MGREMARVFRAIATFARLPWKGEGETKERDTLHIAAQRADGALADAATVPTGNLEHGIRLLTLERDALRAEMTEYKERMDWWRTRWEKECAEVARLRAAQTELVKHHSPPFPVVSCVCQRFVAETECGP